jgi:hypothetical protein
MAATAPARAPRPVSPASAPPARPTASGARKSRDFRRDIAILVAQARLWIETGSARRRRPDAAARRIEHALAACDTCDALPARITKTSFATKLPPLCRRRPDAPRHHRPEHGNNREDQTMRKTLIALTAATGLIGLGTIGASAAPTTPVHVPAQASAIQQADWYCGPHCQNWRHERWERHAWREHHRPYYGYSYNSNYGYPYYRR